MREPDDRCFKLRGPNGGFRRFDLAYFRHTERWFRVYRGLPAAECFREIEENEIFWPTT